MEAKNEFAIRRLFLAEQYFTMMHKIEAILAEYRVNLAKTRSLSKSSFHGVAEGAQIDPTILVNVADCIFTLNDKCSNSCDVENQQNVRSRRQKQEENNEKESASKPATIAFKPFGIMEPECAKLARKNIQTVLPLLCDLASIYSQIRQLDS